MNEHRKSSWPLWVTVLFVIAPVLYVLSAGPFVWLDSQGHLNGGLRDVVMLIYSPLGWSIENGPKWWTDALDAYFNLWDE